MQQFNQNDWDDHTFEHSELRQLAPNLWWIEGHLKRGPMTRNMVIYRMATGELLVHSVIALKDDTLKALLALGEPKMMIVPNGLHRLDAQRWKSRFPNILVFCPKAAMEKVAQKVKVNGSCEDHLESFNISFHKPEGIKPFELTYELAVPHGKVLVMTDILMNLPHFSGFHGFFLRHIGSTGFFGMTKIGRLFLLEDKELFRRWLLQLGQRTDLLAISLAHGYPITSDVGQRLKEAAGRL